MDVWTVHDDEMLVIGDSPEACVTELKRIFRPEVEWGDLRGEGDGFVISMRHPALGIPGFQTEYRDSFYINREKVADGRP